MAYETDESYQIAKAVTEARWRNSMDRNCDSALHDFLFKHKGTELVNLKLLRGDSPDVTKEQICEQLRSAFVQKAANQARTVSDFPSEGGAGSVDLAGLEKKL
jgi:hypothetical protein